MKKILLISLIVAVGIVGYIFPLNTEISVGGDGSKFVGSNVLFLSSGITSSQTSLTLTKFQVPNTTQPIQMTDFGDVGYVTIEPGRTKREFVSFTGITQNSGGTATLTGVSRGLSPIAPYTASTTQQFSHSGGVQVIVSNPPQLYNDAVFKKNDETITGLFSFTGELPTVSKSATTSLQVVNKSTLDAVTNQGAATSTETNGGIVELATQIEQASTTDDGTGNKPLALYAKYSTSTPDGTSQAGLFAVISKINGKIHQLFIDLTENYTWTGTHQFATTTSIGSSASGGLVPAGSIIAYATTTAPAGWLLADGASLATSTFPDLFTAIGFGYGGSGANFNIPDLRNRQITMASTTANLGQTGGEQDHTMTEAELVAHTHAVQRGSGAGGNTDISDADGGTQRSETTTSTGGGIAFNVLDPYIVLHYIIKY